MTRRTCRRRTGLVIIMVLSWSMPMYTLPAPLPLLAFALLAVALLLAACGRRRTAWLAAVAVLPPAVAGGLLTLPALAVLLLLAALSVVLAKQPAAPLYWGGALLAILALALHRVPGVAHPLLWQGQLDAAARPYALYWHLDKGLAGLWLLLTLPTPAGAMIRPRARVLIAIPLLLVLAVAIAWGGQLLAWAPKWPAWWLPWLAANLLLTALPEEALFRQALFAALPRQAGRRGFLLLSALLFGLAHLGGGVVWALTAACAGLAYGLAYLASGRVLTAALLHCAFNCLHLALFTYPQLA